MKTEMEGVLERDEKPQANVAPCIGSFLLLLVLTSEMLVAPAQFRDATTMKPTTTVRAASQPA